jgi:hypothetical protein
MLAGCVPPPANVIPTSVPTAAPVFASEDEALAAAVKAYEGYLEVSDRILMDRGVNPERLLAVATKDVLAKQLPGFDQARKMDLRSTGGSKVDTITLQAYEPRTADGKGIVTVYACVDVSSVNVYDSNGRSIVSPNRPNRSPFEAQFDLSSPGATSLILAREDPWSGRDFC